MQGVYISKFDLIPPNSAATLLRNQNRKVQKGIGGDMSQKRRGREGERERERGRGREKKIERKEGLEFK